jgi:hypothetical protein
MVDLALVRDTFTRTVAAGSWGTPETGAAWTLTTAADFSVNGTTGRMAMGTAGTSDHAFNPVTVLDLDVYAEYQITALPTGASVSCGSMARALDDQNFYKLALNFLTDGTYYVSLVKRVAGTFTTLAMGSTFTAAANTVYRTRFNIAGSTLQGRAWTGTEPSTWDVTAADTDLAGNPGKVGARAIRSTGNTNSGLVVVVDNFLANPVLTGATGNVTAPQTPGITVGMVRPTYRDLVVGMAPYVYFRMGSSS